MTGLAAGFGQVAVRVRAEVSSTEVVWGGSLGARILRCTLFRGILKAYCFIAYGGGVQERHCFSEDSESNSPLGKFRHFKLTISNFFCVVDLDGSIIHPPLARKPP